MTSSDSICRICANRHGNVHYQAREMMLGLRETFGYFQCSTCHCLQIEQVPTDLARFYPANYNGYQSPRTDVFSGLRGHFRRQQYQAALFPAKPNGFPGSLFPAGQYSLPGRIGLRPDSRILDVGCGRGAYLYPLYELGMKQVQGLEPFLDESILYPNGYRVQKGFIGDAVGLWDVIIYNHAFEHVPDPLADMRAIADHLAPNGTALIRIPTVSSHAWDHYRTDWFQLDAPRHLFLHSVESMTLLTEKAELRVTEIIYDSGYDQFMTSELYRKDIAMSERPKRTLADKIRKWRYARQATQLNREQRGDQAAFFLKHA